MDAPDHEFHTPVFQVAETDKGFSYWLGRPFVNDGLRSQIENAKILLVPQEGFREFDEPVFPRSTSDFIQYAKEHPEFDKSVDVCISDEQFHEYALNFEPLVLPTILVTGVLLPIVTNVIANYVSDWIIRRKGDSGARLELLIDESGDGNRVLSFKYEGPSEELIEALKSIKTVDDVESQYLEELPSADDLGPAATYHKPERE